MKKLDFKILSENIEQAAVFDLENQNISGCSYYVYQEDSLTFKKHFGYDLTSGNPLSDKTIFRLASMTKPVTAFAVMILIDRGVLTLDSKAKDFIPELDRIHIITPEGNDLGELKKDVTIRNLLTHTSGIGSIKPIKLTEDDRQTAENMVSAFIKAGLDFEPFTRADYSGVAAFSVAALIIEKVTGKSYYEFLKEEIFIPCGMSDTAFVPTSEQECRIITMHKKIDAKNAVGETFPGCIFENYPASNNLGGAGLFSTLSDYASFAHMLLNEGVTGSGKRLIREETFRLMKTPLVPQSVMPQNIYSWGLGVRVITNPSYPTLPVGGYGWSGAYGSHFWIDPENEVCAVFMKNSLFDGGAGNKSAVRFEQAVFDSFKE